MGSSYFHDQLEMPERNPVFGRKVARMKSAGKFVTGATLKVVRIANFSATPQMGNFVSMRSSNEPFKHDLSFFLML